MKKSLKNVENLKKSKLKTFHSEPAPHPKMIRIMLRSINSKNKLNYNENCNTNRFFAESGKSKRKYRNIFPDHFNLFLLLHFMYFSLFSVISGISAFNNFSGNLYILIYSI